MDVVFFLQSIQLSWLCNNYYCGYWAFLSYFVIVLFVSFPFFIFGALIFYRPIFLSALWTLIEWFRSIAGFPFNLVGLGLTFHHFGMQIVAWSGIFGLSFWIIFISLLSAQRKYLLWSICSALPFIHGFIYLWINAQACVTGKMYHVALIQTGLSEEERGNVVMQDGDSKKNLSLEEQWARVQRFLDDTQREHFDLIVFPETAFPSDIISARISCEENVQMAQNLARKYDSEIIIGLIQGDKNAAFYISPQQKCGEVYEKQILVPFGEYLPITFLMPIVQSVFHFVPRLSPGKKTKVFYGKIPLSVSICYEECFGFLVRNNRKEGARILVNITNDGWFPHSCLSLEHFYYGRARAVENGAHVIRACHTGISGAIHPSGQVLEMEREDFAGVICTTIADLSQQTIFTRFGDSPILFVCCVIVFVFCIAKFLQFVN